MRLISRNIDEKTGGGSVKLEAADSEDMWHIYNLLTTDDILRAPTFRKVQQESNTGSSVADRLRLVLGIKVSSVDYDVSTVSIRVSGRIAEENVHVRIGAFHTIDLEPFRAFTLTKTFWDSIHVDRLTFALDPTSDADVGAVVMQEGLAHVLVISRSLTITRARIEKAIPRKGKNALFNRDGAMKAFFKAVLTACLNELKWDVLKVVLIASPGFVKDEFFKYTMLEASRQDLRKVIDNKNKMILCHASSGHKHALDEVLTRPEIQSRLSKTKAVGEIQLLSEFHAMLKKDESRAVYGESHVKHASEMCAIEKLLVTDTLFRSQDLATRKKYVQLVEEAKQSGASVTMFSTQHVSGEQLMMMSGVAALLRFPLADLDDIDPDATL